MLVDHCTEQKIELSKRKYPELENLQKPKKTNCFLMDAIKIHCKTHHFQYFWLQDRSPKLEKPKKTNRFSMVAIKKHCKTQYFCNFCSPKSLSRTSPEPLQNLSKIEVLRSWVCVYIYSILEQPGLTMEREAPFSCIA